jgi:hypothetical protein
MDLLLRCELIAIFVSPILLALLRRRALITDRQTALTIATLLSLFIGSLYISLGKPETLFSVPFKDWLVAIPFSLFICVVLYLLLPHGGK